MDIHVAIDAQTAAEDAADWVAAQVRNAVRRRGAASLALSGGSTPALMLAGLVQRDVPWGQVTVWQVDERVAPDGDRRATPVCSTCCRCDAHRCA